jgi:tetratricopeptide (TPR) repeat protein
MGDLQSNIQQLLLGKQPQALAADIETAGIKLTELVLEESITPLQASVAAATLNKLRLFGLAVALCNASLRINPTLLKATRTKAQALIELGDLSQAHGILLEVVHAHEASPPPRGSDSFDELAECTGLLGRIAKQRFLQMPSRDGLSAAIAQYQKVLDLYPSKYAWAIVNLIALKSRSLALGFTTHDIDDVTEQATKALANLTQQITQIPDDNWLLVSASELAMSLGNSILAEALLYRFLKHPQTRPFDIGSFRRQLVELWAVDANEGSIAKALLAIVDEHLEVQGVYQLAKIRALSNSVTRGFEANFKGEQMFDVARLQLILETCKSIGIVKSIRGSETGTGFLIDLKSLDNRANSEIVFVTNAHVISDVVAKAIAPSDAYVNFELDDGPASKKRHDVEKILFSSAPGPLGVPSPDDDLFDVTIVRLKSLPLDAKPLAVRKYLPLLNEQAKAFVIGHPQGSGLQISLLGSKLLDISDNQKLLHYETPTEPGSSGSPVFSTAWMVIGIHHAGETHMPKFREAGTYAANEGISMVSIGAKISSTIKPSSKPAEVK